MSDRSVACPHCDAVFVGDRSQEGAYHQSLRSDDMAERERLLGVINPHWALTFHMKAAHPDQMFTCPRQGEGPQGREPGRAFWNKDGTCSYCGSISQDRFFEAAESGCKITPTDKSYKAYVDLPPTGLERVVSSTWSVEAPGEKYIEATPDVCERLNYEPWGNPGRAGDKHWVTVGIDRHVHAKFYFQHLDADGQKRFIDLHNAKRMALAYPGHFYSRPFFCAVETAAA